MLLSYLKHPQPPYRENLLQNLLQKLLCSADKTDAASIALKRIQICCVPAYHIIVTYHYISDGKYCAIAYQNFLNALYRIN